MNLFPLDGTIESAVDLTDGYVLSKMLGKCIIQHLFVPQPIHIPILTNRTEDINPAYAIHDLEKNTSPSKWLTKKKSLEAVYRSLFRYIREECPDLSYLALENPVDFNAIAEHDDTQQTIKVARRIPTTFAYLSITNTCIKLLTIFLMAAVQGPRNEAYVTAITTKLDKAAQGEIAIIIQKVVLSDS